MRPHDNPYTPNAGARPPVLVGRDDQLESFEILLDRLRRGHTEQSMLITGLRGVGKTVLLTSFEERARESDWTTVEAEITKATEFGPRMAQLARRALFQLAPKARWKERAARAAAVLRSFQLTVASDGSLSAGLDVEAADGFADSGKLDDDLTDLLVALGEAAREHESGVVFLIDEVHFLSVRELEALIAALHKTVQRQLPVTLVGPVCPSFRALPARRSPTRSGCSSSRDRAAFPVGGKAGSLVGPVARSTYATRRLRQGNRGLLRGISLLPTGVRKRLVGSREASPITAKDVVDARAAVEAKLDGGFFRVRAERTTELELRYMRAMAELGPQPQQAKDVAALLSSDIRADGTDQITAHR